MEKDNVKAKKKNGSSQVSEINALWENIIKVKQCGPSKISETNGI